MVAVDPLVLAVAGLCNKLDEPHHGSSPLPSLLDLHLRSAVALLQLRGSKSGKVAL